MTQNRRWSDQLPNTNVRPPVRMAENVTRWPTAREVALGLLLVAGVIVAAVLLGAVAL